jgi:hypothetical protein
LLEKTSCWIGYRLMKHLSRDLHSCTSHS